MQNQYQYTIKNPRFDTLGYIVAIANVEDKHDRSAPSDYHWKILKCRMIIFSNSSILCCPDKTDLKQVHIIFNKLGDYYDRLNSLFLKFSLVQDGVIRTATPDVFQMCFQYTMTAKLAPIWNTLGNDYFINNRDFLNDKTPQDGIKYHIGTNDNITTLELKPVKINLFKTNDDFMPGELIRVLPSLNKAIVEECCESLPEVKTFKSYKDLRRHWKNIHGYRLPEDESSILYCTVRFWRGEPLTYPKICLLKNFPIVTPVPKSTEKIVLSRFINCLRNKMSHVLGAPLAIQYNGHDMQDDVNERFSETQAVSLCTPTQAARSSK